MKKPLICGALLMGLLWVVGCGESGIPREAISGTVTLDGKPVPQGSILFMPLGEGPSVGGEIADGKYHLPRDVGPSPGEYRVEISAWRESGKSVFDAATGNQDAVLVSVIPARYNQNSELTAEVTAGGENTFDFDLASK